MSIQTSVQNKVNDILKKIVEEIIQLYAAFRGSKETIVGRKIIDVNRVDTRYCYVVDIILATHPEVKIGLRVVCELDFEVYDDNVIDWSDIRHRKELLIHRLRERLAV